MRRVRWAICFSRSQGIMLKVPSDLFLKERITNYEKCKSFHEFLAVALEVMLYEQYLNTIDNKNGYYHNLLGNKKL